MILLDIPQGVVTFASAVLAAIVLVMLTLATFGFRYLFALQGRVSRFEAITEILWEEHLRGVRNLGTVDSPENPMKQERWNELADKLAHEKLSDDEAEEFLSALLRREEQARKEKDRATIAILSHGIILTKWQLKEKELREQK